MLKRVTGELFRARVGERIQIRASATGNPGSDIATFEYADEIVENDAGSTSQCTFDVLPGIQQFQAVVVFASGAPGDAQYDLFEIDSGGEPQPLDEFVSPDGSVPMIGFGIRGVAVAVGASAPSGPGPVGRAAKAPRPSTPSKKAGAKKAGARKAGVKKSGVSQTAKKTAKKTAAATKTLKKAAKKPANKAGKKAGKKPAKKAGKKATKKASSS